MLLCGLIGRPSRVRKMLLRFWVKCLPLFSLISLKAYSHGRVRVWDSPRMLAELYQTAFRQASIAFFPTSWIVKHFAWLAHSRVSNSQSNTKLSFDQQRGLCTSSGNFKCGTTPAYKSALHITFLFTVGNKAYEIYFMLQSWWILQLDATGIIGQGTSATTPHQLKSNRTTLYHLAACSQRS